VQVNGYSLLGDKADRHEMNYRSPRQIADLQKVDIGLTICAISRR